MRTLPSTAALLLLASLPLLAQEPTATIEVGADRLVSAGAPELPLVEPHLQAHPADSRHLLAGAMLVGSPEESAPTLDTIRCATFVSFDGGASWMQREVGMASCGDPWVALFSDTSAAFAGLGDRGELLVHHSADGGRSWPVPPVSLGRGHDHPTMAVDTARGLLYVVSGQARRLVDRRLRWTVHVSRSRNAGRSFEHTTNEIPFVLNFEPSGGAVLGDGTLAVLVADHHALDNRNVVDRAWVLLSGDGARTFTEPILVTDLCYGRGGWPSLAADASAGRLYLLCIAADYGGVQLFHSTDRGESWNGPIRVDQAGEAGYAATPAMAVDQDGVLGVAWYDLRDNPHRKCMRLYFTASLDGGATFLPERVVSTEPSCPSAGRNGAAAERWRHGGDYSGLAALGGGRFQILWSDSRDGLYRLRTAEVRVAR